MLIEIDCKTNCIAPHPILKPYIRYFAIRNFDTGVDTFPKAMIADHEMTMVFFLHSKLFGFEVFSQNDSKYIINQNSQCCFTGILTSTKGFIIFKGPVTILNIHFKPAGFFHIFNISPKELVDKMDENKNILSNEIALLHEQMHEEKNISGCIKLLEHYLIKRLLSKKSKYRHQGILKASQFFLKQMGKYPIKELASDCNMTLQTLEVQFTEQVGISPKYFSRLLRFGQAVNLKTYNPKISWTNITYDCGYFDQMHLIKDFKKFTSLSPKNFMELIHPPVENFISQVLFAIFSISLSPFEIIEGLFCA